MAEQKTLFEKLARERNITALEMRVIISASKRNFYMERVLIFC